MCRSCGATFSQLSYYRYRLALVLADEVGVGIEGIIFGNAGNFIFGASATALNKALNMCCAILGTHYESILALALADLESILVGRSFLFVVSHHDNSILGLRSRIGAESSSQWRHFRSEHHQLICVPLSDILAAQSMSKNLSTQGELFIRRAYPLDSTMPSLWSVLHQRFPLEWPVSPASPRLSISSSRTPPLVAGSRSPHPARTSANVSLGHHPYTPPHFDSPAHRDIKMARLADTPPNGQTASPSGSVVFATQAMPFTGNYVACVRATPSPAKACAQPSHGRWASSPPPTECRCPCSSPLSAGCGNKQS